MGFDAFFPIAVMQRQVFIVEPGRAVIPIAVVIMLGCVQADLFFCELDAMAQGVGAVVFVRFQVMLHRFYCFETGKNAGLGAEGLENHAPRHRAKASGVNEAGILPFWALPRQRGFSAPLVARASACKTWSRMDG